MKMQIINTPSIEEARKQIDKIKKQSPEEKIALISQDPEFNRKALEIKKLNALIINEDLDTRDYSKQRNSGLNEILCNIATKNSIAIGIQLQEIIKKPDVEKARALARLKQNIMLIKKSRTKMFISNLDKSTNIKDAAAIFLSLGASTKQVQEIVNFKFN